MATYRVSSPFAGQYDIELNFSFIDKTHVKVKRKLNGESTYTNLTYNDSTQWNSNLAGGYPVNANVYRVVLGNEIGLGNTLYYVQFSRAYDPQAIYIVYRETSTYVPAFVNGSALTAEDLNSAFLQLSYQAEEKDQIGISEATINLDGKFDKAGGTISGATTINANLSMGGNRIENVATPVSANQVATKQYVDLANSVGGVPTILPDSITATELSKVAGSQAVSTATIQNLAVTSAKIADGNVGTTQIADASVTGDKLGNIQGAIRCASDGSANPLYESSTNTAGSILNLQRPVTSNSIRVSAITTTKIADGAVTAVKLGTDAVTTAKILNSNVTGEKIANSTITSAKLLTSGLSFTSDGNLTAQATDVASLTSTGDVSVPSYLNHKLTNSWSSIDPTFAYTNGFSIEYIPQGVNYALPPLTRRVKANNAYPYRVCLSQRDWKFMQTGNTLTSLIPNATWSNRVFNIIDFNNTSFFTLNADGSFTFSSSADAYGTWLIEGFLQFGWDGSTAVFDGYSRMFGPGYARTWPTNTEVISNTWSSSDINLFDGTSCHASGSTITDPKSMIRGVIKVLSGTSCTFKLQHYVQANSFGSIGYKASSSPYSALNWKATLASVSLTKISDSDTY